MKLIGQSFNTILIFSAFKSQVTVMISHVCHIDGLIVDENQDNKRQFRNAKTLIPGFFRYDHNTFLRAVVARVITLSNVRVSANCGG